jgi:hypothetical protein
LCTAQATSSGRSDTYKAPGHIATVVALLPTTEQLRFQGGTLRIGHTGQFSLSSQVDWTADSAVRAAIDDSSNAAACERITEAEPSGAVQVSWAAFYCDCEHEVREVTSGHRNALLLNLIRHSELRNTPLPDDFAPASAH